MYRNTNSILTGHSLVFGIWMCRVIKGPFCTIRLGLKKCLENAWSQSASSVNFKQLHQISFKKLRHHQVCEETGIKLLPGIKQHPLHFLNW